MKVLIPLYDRILKVVSFFSKQLKFDKRQNKLGRKLALKINEVISLAIFKQRNGIPTKISLYRIFELKTICSYKTLVVNLNRWARQAALLLFLILKINRVLIVKPRKNMKQVMTEFEEKLYETRMVVEISFRVLKTFHGLITSLPRSVGGYLANYIYSLLAL